MVKLSCSNFHKLIRFILTMGNAVVFSYGVKSDVHVLISIQVILSFFTEKTGQ